MYLFSSQWAALPASSWLGVSSIAIELRYSGTAVLIVPLSSREFKLSSLRSDNTTNTTNTTNTKLPT